MRKFDLRKALISSVMGAAVIAGSAMMASAQNVSREYRDWQRAEQMAQQEYRDYQRSGDRRDYNQWQAAVRRAQIQRAQYERTARLGTGYNTGYGYNAGYNNTRRGMYRIYRNGSYYSVDQRGADLLRQAVNSGYAQGYRQGQVARQYGRAYDYNRESMYRSGTYGYQSYVARDQYQYYFQQGFQRGFEDGYNSTTQYGYRTNNGLSILGGVLNSILNIAAQ